MSNHHDPFTRHNIDGETQAGPAWAEVFLSFFNLSTEYFPTLLFFLGHPLASAQRLRNHVMMSGPKFFIAGLGCLFICWTASALVRQSNTAATMLNLFGIILLLFSTYAFASAAHALGVPLSRYRISRDVYLYSMGSFTVWGLILVDLSGLISTSMAIGSPTPACPLRGLDCLIQHYGDAPAYHMALTSIQLGLGLVAIPFTIIVFSVAQHAAWWKGLAAMAVATVANLIVSSI